MTLLIPHRLPSAALDTVEPAGAGGAEVGDLLDVNLMCVRVTS
jgi:hypothetical protein